jgi:hypothetical protein
MPSDHYGWWVYLFFICVMIAAMSLLAYFIGTQISPYIYGGQYLSQVIGGVFILLISYLLYCTVYPKLNNNQEK